MHDDTEDEATDRARARVGTTLAEKWTLDRLLGVGGMAAVYRATHRNGNEVALKLLHPELSREPGIRERFLREGYVANKVKHPGAVTVFDDDVTADGAAFLVMELLHGETLQARLDRMGGRLPAGEVLGLAEQLLAVLGAAHARGIVHRDLKPENLFLCEDGSLKVLDFGIARLRELSGDPATATQTGGMLGTPVFMAPEQARGRWDEVDAQTDLWAVGATLFTMVSGRFVHEAETLNEVLGLAMTQRARSVTSVEPAVPPSLAQIIDRALAYEKPTRWADAGEMGAAVRAAERALAGGSASPRVEASPADSPSADATLVSVAVPAGGASPARPSSATLTTGRGVASEATPRHAGIEPAPSPRGSSVRRAVVAGGAITLAASAGVAVWMVRGGAGTGFDVAAVPVPGQPSAGGAAVPGSAVLAAPSSPGALVGPVLGVDDLAVTEEPKKPPDPPRAAAPAPPSARPAAPPGPMVAAPPAASQRRPDPFAKRR
ncbi:MAG: protein kinase [Polyangiaceae bacterium]|nr:protein kinase [Polyangiaceae bacterium]